MVAFALLLLSGVPLMARGNSAGADPACFDGSFRLCDLPCPNDTPRSWTTTKPDGTLFPCCPAGMDLVAPPTRSAFYSISASVSEYTPCEALTISIDVRNTDYKYLGLLLYAIRVDASTETRKVGEWLLPSDRSHHDRFWAPPGCKGAAVMHSSAVTKNYHEEFRFRAPAAGTGALRFRAVVKHGETNGGAFYWPSASTSTDGPVTANDLIIQETSTTPLPLLRWLFANAGKSCQEICAAASMSCDGPHMADALGQSGTAQLLGSAGPSSAYTCNMPLLSQNGASCDSGKDELHADESGDCFYRSDAVCPKSTPQQLCSTTSAGRFCACQPTSQGDTRGAVSGRCPHIANPWTLNVDSDLDADADAVPGEGAAASPFKGIEVVDLSTDLSSSGTKQKASSTAAVLATTCAYALAFPSTKRIVVATIMMLLASPTFVSGHNWINNPKSRAEKLSTVNPCPPADLTRPAHMQVGPGQSFEVEFMTGHSWSSTYFAIVLDKDEKHLRSHNERMFERYIKEAEGIEGASVPGPERQHVGYSKSNKGTWAGYARELTSADPEYIARPGAFFRKYSSGKRTQYKYTDEARKFDVFVSYTNARWPWLEGVYRFKNGPSFPEEWDIVNLNIPARTGRAGRHILHYVWRGYRDCIDIDVLSPGQVATDRWGKPGKKKWRRIDHCQFENYKSTRPARTKCVALGKTGGLMDCLKGCNAKRKDGNWGCNAVNVVPAANPVTTAPIFQDIKRCEDVPRHIPAEKVKICTVNLCKSSQGAENCCIKYGQKHCEEICLNREKRIAQAPYKACKKKFINIPWETSVFTSVDKQQSSALTPVTSGICRESDFKPWANNKDPALVCYGILAYQPTDQQVGDMWTVTADPSDPVFYSSCYIYGPLQRTFKGPSCGAACAPKPASLISSAEWKFADKCISCEVAAQATKVDLLKVPKWSLSDTCRKCDALEG